MSAGHRLGFGTEALTDDVLLEGEWEEAVLAPTEHRRWDIGPAGKRAWLLEGDLFLERALILERALTVRGHCG